MNVKIIEQAKETVATYLIEFIKDDSFPHKERMRAAAILTEIIEDEEHKGELEKAAVAKEPEWRN